MKEEVEFRFRILLANDNGKLINSFFQLYIYILFFYFHKLVAV